MASVLAFVEDPGAANFVAELPAELAALSVPVTIAAAGVARPYLEDRIGEVRQADGLDAGSLLKQFEPSLVLVGTSGNPDSLGLQLVAESAERGIPTVGVIDSPESAPDRFRGNSSDALRWAPDVLLVPDEWTGRLYVRLGYSEQQVVVCGHPHYDHVRDIGRRLRTVRARLRESLYPRAPAGSPVVLFSGERSEGLDPLQYRRSDEYTLVGRGDSPGRSEVVIEEFLDAIARQRPTPHCVLRVHPKHDVRDFDRYLDGFQQISTSENALEMIVGADAVVGMTTMLLTEAVLLGTPTLSIVPRDLERGWLAATQLGLTPCATTRDQVREEVGRLLGAPGVPDDAEVEALLPSGASRRAAEAIDGVLQRTAVGAATPEAHPGTRGSSRMH